MACPRIFCTMPNLIIPELNGTLAVVCHDAGATNHIVSWLRSSQGVDFKAAVFGPAAFIWQQAFPSDHTSGLLKKP